MTSLMEGRGEFPNSASPSNTGSSVGRRTPRRNGPSLADLASPCPTTPRSTSKPLMPIQSSAEPRSHDFWIKLRLLSLKVLKYAVIFGCVVVGIVFLAFAFYNALCDPIKYINIFFMAIGVFLFVLAIVGLLSYLIGFSLEHFYGERIPEAAGYSNNNRPGDGWQTIWSPAPADETKPNRHCCPPSECPYCKPLGLRSTIPPDGLHGQCICQCQRQAIPDNCEESLECKNIELCELDECEDEDDWFNRQIQTVPLIPSDFPACQAERMRINALRCAAVMTVKAPMCRSPVDPDNGRCGRRRCASPEPQNATTCTRQTQRPLRQLPATFQQSKPLREQPTTFQQPETCKQQPTTCRKHSVCRSRPHPQPKQLSPHTCLSGTRTRRNSNSPEVHRRNSHSTNNSNPEGSPRVLPHPGCYAPPPRPPEFAFFRTDDDY